MWCFLFLSLFCQGWASFLGPDTLDLDDNLQWEIQCFWKRFCTDAQPLEYKGITDFVSESALSYYKDQCLTLLDPPDIHEEYATLEHVRRDETWTEIYRTFVCSLNQEKKDKYLNGFVSKIITGMQEICESDRQGPDCLSIMEAGTHYRKLMAEKKAKGHCK